MAYHIFMLPCQGIKLNNAVHFVAEEFHPDGKLVVVGQMNIHRVPFYTELVADKIHIVALILQI